MSRSYVVTGAGGGIGRALVERLLDDADGNAVVAIELDPAALSWLEEELIPSTMDSGKSKPEPTEMG